ncbi:hypothetical protein LEP1GSC124_2686 [Leptospira interrogans serovar Pyrogenes str. 200701872]|uniref:Uncharacterized protein n=1 Tax=Leptospira interrogans serovar Pyrogenes str. 200701872 TaxID=1193029 RepID=M6ZUM0_LEPIR|nr:hypothetical protein LEP1GSC124_2686 [Leptospira interrogans serovar Pyrogenes str. 200701872]
MDSILFALFDILTLFQGRLISGVKEDVNKALKSKQLKKAVALD